MSIAIERVVSLAAIYAIALQTILLGITPVAGFRYVDPFLVICRGDGQALASTTQTDRDHDQQPGQGCQHCTLCNTSTPPSVPFTAVGLIAFFGHALVFFPTPARPCIGVVSGHKLPRGPPQIVLT